MSLISYIGSCALLTKHRAMHTSLLLLSLSIFNLIFIWKHWYTTQPDLYSYRGHDFPESLPLALPISKVLLTVEETTHYALEGYKSDAEWFSLASDSYGYVRLGSHNRIFVVAMFHQLHCLRILNLGFNHTQAVGDAHLQHCLSYLRQMILCDPDLTLEPAGWEAKDFESQRVGATHECRDWSSVYEAVDRNYQRWNGIK